MKLIVLPLATLPLAFLLITTVVAVVDNTVVPDGIALPRDVRAQYGVGKAITPDELTAGDIVFFTTTEPGPSHVAIAIGGDEFVHAPSSAGVVRVEHLSSSYWSPRFLGARRVAN